MEYGQGGDFSRTTTTGKVGEKVYEGKPWKVLASDNGAAMDSYFGTRDLWGVAYRQFIGKMRRDGIPVSNDITQESFMKAWKNPVSRENIRLVLSK